MRLRTLDTKSMYYMIVSSAENKSLPYCDEYFPDEFEPKHLPELDICFPNLKILIENKIDKDIKDIQRYADELTRSNTEKYKGWQKHVIWICRYPDVETMKWAIGICQRANVYFHHCYYMDKQEDWKEYYTSNWVAMVKKIRRNEYRKPLQYHKKPSKNLSILAKMLACFPGISEEKAIEIAKYADPWKIDELSLHKLGWDEITETIKNICGRKKDGTPYKLGLKLIKWLETGEEP